MQTEQTIFFTKCVRIEANTITGVLECAEGGCMVRTNKCGIVKVSRFNESFDKVIECLEHGCEGWTEATYDASGYLVPQRKKAAR